MVLVVTGHHLLPFMPSWYRSVHYYIYLFHMPFFIFISAFLIRYSYKQVSNAADYWSYIRKKAVKFFPPYLLVGGLCVLLKCFGNMDMLLHEVSLLFYDPLGSEATFLWYLYLLFIFYLISPLVFQLRPSVHWLLFAVSIVMWLYPVTSNVFCAAYFCKLSPFYMAGVLVAERSPLNMMFWRKVCLVALVAFLVLTVLHFRMGYQPLLERMFPWVGIPALTCLSWLLGQSAAIKRGLVHVSVNCFGIYLIHMFYVQAIALVVSHFMVLDSAPIAVVYLTMSVFACIWLASITWRWFAVRIHL